MQPSSKILNLAKELENFKYVKEVNPTMKQIDSITKILIEKPILKNKKKTKAILNF